MSKVLALFRFNVNLLCVRDFRQQIIEFGCVARAAMSANVRRLAISVLAVVVILARERAASAGGG